MLDFLNSHATVGTGWSVILVHMLPQLSLIQEWILPRDKVLIPVAVVVWCSGLILILLEAV